MARVRAFLPPLNPPSKIQKGLRNIRVPPRHITEGWGKVSKRERCYSGSLVQIYPSSPSSTTCIGHQLRKEPWGSAEQIAFPQWLVQVEAVMCWSTRRDIHTGTG